MLDYLLYLIEQNIVFIFIVVLALSIASQFSKTVKNLFFVCLCLVGTYFVLLCLYKLGFGSPRLYEVSCKYVYTLCFLFEKVAITIPHCDYLVIKFMQILSTQTMDNVMLIINVLITLMAMSCLSLSFFVVVKKEERIFSYPRKEVYRKEKVQAHMPLFILHDVFRC